MQRQQTKILPVNRPKIVNVFIYCTILWNIIHSILNATKLSSGLLLMTCWTDSDVDSERPSESCSSGCHANQDSFIRQLCFDSFHARHPASASCDDVISAGSGSANGAAAVGSGHARRRDVIELQRLPLVDRQIGVVSNQSRDQLEHHVTADWVLQSDSSNFLTLGSVCYDSYYFQYFSGEYLLNCIKQ